MPLWYREAKAHEQDAQRGEPRPGIDELGAWRETTDVCVLEALEMYATFLAGQTSGLSDALSLPAVESALRITRHPLEDRPGMTLRLLRIHGNLRDIQRREEKLKGKPRG